MSQSNLGDFMSPSYDASNMYVTRGPNISSDLTWDSWNSNYHEQSATKIDVAIQVNNERSFSPELIKSSLIDEIAKRIPDFVTFDTQRDHYAGGTHYTMRGSIQIVPDGTEKGFVSEGLVSIDGVNFDRDQIIKGMKKAYPEEFI